MLGKITLVAATPSPDAAGRKLADIAKALPHACVRILRLLLATPGCIRDEIIDAVALAQSSISQHLRILTAKCVITDAISGPCVCYALNPQALFLMAAFVASLKAPDNDACCILKPKAALSACLNAI